MCVCLSCGPNGFCLVLMFPPSSLLSPVGDIAPSLGDAKGACNSAFNFTVGHPENELTTAKRKSKML
ncbi:hypothetical protein TNCV_1910291 [Trichonephila clavipes]|nr:hypothetical protein TNCV_1910291 [Trichonephila clavipes]